VASSLLQVIYANSLPAFIIRERYSYGQYKKWRKKEFFATPNKLTEQLFLT
jgi:hypothetical protein